MEYPVNVYEIAREAKPEAKPTPAPGFTVRADTVEDARRAALERLAEGGRSVRSLSFTADGGLAAVVYSAPAPPVPPPRAARRAKGGR
jgi:hypothetical protein